MIFRCIFNCEKKISINHKTGDDHSRRILAFVRYFVSSAHWKVLAKARIPDGATVLIRETTVYKKRKSGKLPKRGPRFKLIDLFAGAGGMTLGFTRAFGHNFESVWANDFDEACCETYRANFGGHCHHGDIVELLERPDTKIPKADVVSGTTMLRNMQVPGVLNTQRGQANATSVRFLRKALGT